MAFMFISRIIEIYWNLLKSSIYIATKPSSPSEFPTETRLSLVFGLYIFVWSTITCSNSTPHRLNFVSAQDWKWAAEHTRPLWYYVVLPSTVLAAKCREWFWAFDDTDLPIPILQIKSTDVFCVTQFCVHCFYIWYVVLNWFNAFVYRVKIRN